MVLTQDTHISVVFNVLKSKILQNIVRTDKIIGKLGGCRETNSSAILGNTMTGLFDIGLAINLKKETSEYKPTGFRLKIDLDLQPAWGECVM